MKEDSNSDTIDTVATEQFEAIISGTSNVINCTKNMQSKSEALLMLDKLRKDSPSPWDEPSLSLEQISALLDNHQLLKSAIFEAYEKKVGLLNEFPELCCLSRPELIQKLRANILNFYSADSASPYVPLAAKGPWIISLHGGVIYETGGYGMLGFGHDPDFIERALNKKQVMANIMTPCISHYRIIQALKKNIGFKNGTPFSHFCFMNSGSESVAVAARIADAHAKQFIGKGGSLYGRESKYLGIKGGFHGRTFRAAQASSSSHKAYQAMASFEKEFNKLVTIEANNIDQLEAAFADAEKNNYFYELLFIEPVMGEGCAGFPLDTKFYQRARELSKQHSCLLLIDSIQAGLRCHGVLSIVDYPGFENFEAPDFETYSKAVNGGQYPLSILAMSEKASSAYKNGLYGNTMTGNPRALDIASAILNQINRDVINNIKETGVYFKEKLLELQKAFPEIITDVQGVGLLLSAKIKDDLAIEGLNGLELKMRMLGVNVIHGSGNRLRFTPWFLISKAEVDLICNCLRTVIK